ncbi:hypothetical protein V5O48_009456 [Marasmius crinis-equi]|uniref:Uncharacterized protein n=1 Tax=Marasmius crinis-equi TaxID=585013 RepID=A0ABR3FBA1_9AGAR
MSTSTTSSNISTPSKPIRFYEGRVATTSEDDKVLLTTPNNLYIVPPLMGLRSIRMRKDLHFGEEDPLWFPQPYIPGLGYLSVIPFPTSDPSSPHAAAWKPPAEAHFIPAASTDPSHGLGMLSPALRGPLQKAFAALNQRINDYVLDERGKGKESSGLREDKVTTRYIFDLKFLFARLASLSSYREAAMTYALCQRAYLELTARVDWLTTYRRRVDDPSSVRPLDDAKVVGALTGDDETAMRLFHAGIPFWFSQPLVKKEHTRVDRWIQLDQATVLQRIIDNGINFSLEDASPPHSVIFEGPIADPNRYIKMRDFLRKSSTTNVYMTNSSPMASTSTSSQPTSGPSRTPKVSNRYHPTGAPTSSNAQPGDRNKFVDVQSQLMPPALKNWAKAAQDAGAGFDPNVSDPTGYALPDPNFIAGMQNTVTQAAFVTTWLKLRPVLLYRLQSPTFDLIPTKKWRVVLGLEVYGHESNTVAAKKRKEQQEMLQKCLDSGGMGGSIDLENLSVTPVVWQGTPLVPFSLPAASIVREILWESFEINFRYELVALDRVCYRTDASAAQRESEVLGLITHLESSLVPDGIKKANIGFASRELHSASGRRHALNGLLEVMKGWAGGPGQLPRPLDDTAVSARLDIVQTQEVGLPELEALEYALVHHYVSVFRVTFRRAPLLPHSL